MISFIKNKINRETIVYLIFGILTTVVDFVAFDFFIYTLYLNEIVANTIAWMIAVAFAFITNKIFVFKSATYALKPLLKEISAFVAARVVTLVITNVFLIFADYVNMNMLFAKALISVAVIIFNYVFSKLFIFKKATNI